MYKEYPPIDIFTEPGNLKIIFKEGYDDLDIQLGSGIYIGKIFIGKIFTQNITKQILQISNQYQRSIRANYLDLQKEIDINIQNRGYARLFLDCFIDNWKIFRKLDNIGFKPKSELVRLFNGGYELWNYDRNKFNIVDVMLPFDYQGKF